MQRNIDCKDRIGRFYARVKTFFKRVFNGFEDFIDNHIEGVLHFVSALKKAVDNPVTDIATAIIPGTIDDTVVNVLRQRLGTVIEILEIQLTCGKEASPEEKIACYIDYLRNCSPEIRDALYSKTASLLTRLHAQTDGKKFSNAEIDTMVQFAYAKIKHDAKP